MGKPQIKKASRNLAAEHRIAPAQNHNSEKLAVCTTYEHILCFWKISWDWQQWQECFTGRVSNLCSTKTFYLSLELWTSIVKIQNTLILVFWTTLTVNVKIKLFFIIFFENQYVDLFIFTIPGIPIFDFSVSLCLHRLQKLTIDNKKCPEI